MRNRFFAIALSLSILMAAVATPTLASVDDKDYIDTVVVAEPYAEKTAYKLVRGLTNILTSPGEIPKQIVVATQKRGATGPVIGLFQGIGMTVIRAGFGVWETAFFLFPNSMEGDFAPILKPEFVWDASASAP